MLEGIGTNGAYKSSTSSKTRKTDSRNAATNGNYSTNIGALTAPSAGKNAVTGLPTGAGVLASYANKPIATLAATTGTSTSGGSGGGGGGGRSRSGGGGGGGGGGSSLAAAAVPAVKIPTLSDYINKNYLLSSTDAENKRKMQDFDAATASGTDDTEADQAKRDAYLQTSLDQEGNDNAESFASRGLGRSGLVFQGQDKIDAEGEKQHDAIDQLLTDFTRSRSQGRLQQDAANRAARQQVIQQLTDAYNTAANAGTPQALQSLVL